MEITGLAKAELISHTAELIADQDSKLERLKQERTALIIVLGAVVALSAIF